MGRSFAYTQACKFLSGTDAVMRNTMKILFMLLLTRNYILQMENVRVYYGIGT